MTWELAESGCEFITSVINGADLVPTFSAASVDDLRTEVNFWIYIIISLAALCAKFVLSLGSFPSLGDRLTYLVRMLDK